jgi:hypothetical protein
MPNQDYSAAFAEVAALAPTDTISLDCISLSHPNVIDIHLVDDRNELEASIPEAAGVITFEPCSFQIQLPDSTVDGTTHLNVVIPNVTRRISEFLDAIPVDSDSPVVITHRVYLSGQDDSALPENDPPTQMNLTDVAINAFEVKGKAMFVSVITRKYPTEYYTRERFPALTR